MVITGITLPAPANNRVPLQVRLLVPRAIPLIALLTVSGTPLPASM